MSICQPTYSSTRLSRPHYEETSCERNKPFPSRDHLRKCLRNYKTNRTPNNNLKPNNRDFEVEEKFIQATLFRHTCLRPKSRWSCSHGTAGGARSQCHGIKTKAPCHGGTAETNSHCQWPCQGMDRWLKYTGDAKEDHLQKLKTGMNFDAANEFHKGFIRRT